ncbi:MAG: vWA domain-containing protein [Planctomycetota bacterium]|jgi:Ca-activated chloride channel family protein
MNSKENNLEKNISRLVKLTGDSDKPSKSFRDSLVEEALGELEEAGGSRKREEKGVKMGVNWKKALAWAATIMIVCGLGVGVLVSNTKKAGKELGKVAGLTEQPISGQPATKVDDSGRARIEYTEASSKPAMEAEVKSVERSVTKPMDVVVTQVQEQAAQPISALKDTVAIEEMRKARARVNKQQISSNEVAEILAGKGVDKIQPVPTLGYTPAEKRKKEHFYYDRATGVGGKEKNRQIDMLMVMDRQAEVTAESAKVAQKKPMFVGTPKPEKYREGYPMAHGGVVPPNGEDVDAMFFKNYGVNPFIDTEDDHLSTFATDVDTGSYTVVRRFLHDGHLPPEKAVRVEEFVNYFKYGYAAPQEDDFAVYTEASPWKFGTGRKNSFLLRLGLKAKQVSEENRKPAILTFVIDVSESMRRENRLGRVKKCLRMLVEKLKQEDKIGIAVYGSRGRKVMDYKGLNERAEILAAIDSLCTGGSTNAEEGIRIGYEMAEKAYKKGHINRVILCSDGVANVGKTGADGILEVIKKKAEKGVTLSSIGFGMGNYNDVLLERLGDKGNGYYAYIDTIAEAKRIFEDNLTGALQVVARDVKVQIDFNPEVVRSYRLLGYENRDVPDDKFRDDKYDGGEMGAGHSVTALYELKLWPKKKGTVATSYVRYKDAETFAVSEFKSVIGTSDIKKSFDDSNRNFRLAATVAEFAEVLRKSYWAKGVKLSETLKRARKLAGERAGDADISELVDLISKAKQLMEKTDIKPFEGEESEDIIYLQP